MWIGMQLYQVFVLPLIIATLVVHSHFYRLPSTELNNHIPSDHRISFVVWHFGWHSCDTKTYAVRLPNSISANDEIPIQSFVAEWYDSIRLVSIHDPVCRWCHTQSHRESIDPPALIERSEKENENNEYGLYGYGKEIECKILDVLETQFTCQSSLQRYKWTKHKYFYRMNRPVPIEIWIWKPKIQTTTTKILRNFESILIAFLWNVFIVNDYTQNMKKAINHVTRSTARGSLIIKSTTQFMPQTAMQWSVVYRWQPSS